MPPRPGRSRLQGSGSAQQRWKSGGGQQPVTLGLDRSDLRKQELEPVELADNLSFQVFWKCSPVASGECLELCSPVTTERLIARDALRKEQPFDPVHMGDTLGDQHAPLTAETALILFPHRGRPHHRADMRLAALVGEERPDELLAVDAVGLCLSLAPPRAFSVYSNAYPEFSM